MPGQKCKAAAPKSRGNARQAENSNTNSTINNQNSAPENSNTNHPGKSLMIKFSSAGTGGRSRMTAERVPPSKVDDQNPVVKKSDTVSNTNGEASTQQVDEDTDNQKPTFENSDRVPPALKRVKFLIKNKETSIPQVEKNTNDQNPTFENSDIVPPAPKKVKISMKKEKTPTKSNILADALPAPKRKSKRAAKKSGRAISDETGSGGSGSRQSGSGQDGSGETGSGETGSGEIDSGEVGSEELGSGEIGSTEPGHDDEAISFATHRLNDAFNSVDEESVIWKLTHHFSKEQVLLLTSMIKRLPREVPIQDYLQHIRETTKSRRVTSGMKLDPGVPRPAADSGDYWKKQFEDLQGEVHKLKNHITILEGRLRSRPPLVRKPSTVGSDDEGIPSRPLQRR